MCTLKRNYNVDISLICLLSDTHLKQTKINFVHILTFSNQNFTIIQMFVY